MRADNGKTMLKIRTDQAISDSREKITRTIASFWDQISEGWRIIWGPHIHHGFYENDRMLTPLQAQEILMHKLAAKLEISAQSKILDVGCGMGGSSLYLAGNYGANVTGITLSCKQKEIAEKQARESQTQQVNFKIEDALSLASFENNSFDIVWSLESCEQFYDKALFLQQAFRVLKPGGQLMLATWCSGHEEYADKLAKKYAKLCREFDLPYMPTMAHYRKILENQHFEVKEILDWSAQVQKSWDVGISLVNVMGLLKMLKLGGWRGLRFARQIKLMRDGFYDGRVKYGVFIAKKT
jgi:tocopherol O-methyltransferase